MRGSEIIVTSEPKGQFEEGTVSGTPLPGMIAEIVPQSAQVRGGRYSWRASSVTTGSFRDVWVFREDNQQGKTATDAYVNGTACFLYAPLIGEDINVLLAAEPGTGSADAVKVGDLLGCDNSGHVVPNSAYTSTPFKVMEHLSESPAQTPTLIWCKRT